MADFHGIEFDSLTAAYSVHSPAPDQGVSTFTTIRAAERRLRELPRPAVQLSGLHASGGCLDPYGLHATGSCIDPLGFHAGGMGIDPNGTPANSGCLDPNG